MGNESWNVQVNSVWTPTTISQNAYTYDTAGNRLTNAVTDNTGTTRTERVPSG